jgi:hypothetical protein
VNISSRASLACALAFVSFAALGCNRAGSGQDPTGTDAEALASDGADASEASSQAMHLDNLVFASVSSSDPSTAALQASASEAVWPPGCVSRQRTSATQASITFTDCTGPFGLVHLNGSEIATFSAGQGGALHVEIKSQDLTANGKSIDHQASADVTFPSATTIDVAWKGSWQHTTTAGHEIDHQSDLTIVIDEATLCAKATGTGETTVDGRGISTDFEGYQVCRASDGSDACPTGSVAITSESSDASLTIDFDGTDQAEVTTGAHDFSVPLVCGG